METLIGFKKLSQRKGLIVLIVRHKPLKNQEQLARIESTQKLTLPYF